MSPTRVEQSRPPEVDVLFGTPGRALATLELLSVETRLAANQIANAKVMFRQPGGANSNLGAFAADAARAQPGAQVTIRLRDGNLLFKGLVAEQACSQTQGLSELTLRLCHPLQGAVSSHGSRVFAKLTEESVLRQILQTYGIRLSSARGLLTPNHEQLVQYECSDWQFLRARLYANGVWLWPDSEGNVMVAPPALTASQHTLVASSNSIGSTGKHLPLVESVHWMSRNRELTEGVGVASWNPAQQKMESRKAALAALGAGGLDPEQVKHLGAASQAFNVVRDLQKEERQAWADSRLLAMRAASVQASITVIGSNAYALGDTLELMGFGSVFDGRGVISSIEQKMTPGRWRTVVTIGQDMQHDADMPLVPGTPGLQIGVVAAYQKDPQRLNRLRVHVPVLGDDIWARFAAPYASNNSGVCFYPEPGDEVVLGFFGADPRYPVILGAMHSPANPTPIDPVESRQQKGLVLQQGGKVQQLLFDGKAESVLLQSMEDQFTLKKGMTVDTTQALVIQGKDISIKANAKLEASAQQVNIKGNKIDLGM